MSFMDKLKGMVGVEDEDYEEYEEYDDNREVFSAKEENDHRSDRDNSKNKVMNINATAQLKVVLVKPERFEDASSIADHLNAKRTVVLNLESASKEIARRLIDFLSGVAYANNGQIKRVANSTFIITPYNVDVMGDLLDELENNGVFF
ncbi:MULTISPECIES: cell division protein SepF [Clostridiaceae]|uniref:Cell division protein SepF n=1 Tax=Clostridium facile TaxID=2763035 RepID=A0ABR7IQ52_9CLOT|nr:MULTISPECIES: cell division protein SepF [Clostridiaceae]MBC5787243.1 cell division protein SepF [Clostridium facile]PWM99698.1 MAG: cell division protein SepF [Massilioclostridium sp.]